MNPFSPELPTATTVDAASIRRSFRAVAVGTAVILGGSLVLTTLIGVAAIMGMLMRGDGAQTIVAELPDSFALALLCAIGELLMSLIGGYTAATIAGRSPVQHASWTGALAMPLSLLLVAVLGDSGPAWLTGLATVLIVPCAALGGWLAAPIQTVAVVTASRQ